MAETDDVHVLDDEAWAEGERYWRGLVDELLAAIGQSDEWPSWEPKFYGDGVTPVERESRSICDGRSLRFDRAFAIQQWASGTAGISARVEDNLTGIEDFPDIDGSQAANDWFDSVP